MTGLSELRVQHAIYSIGNKRRRREPLYASQRLGWPLASGLSRRVRGVAWRARGSGESGVACRVKVSPPLTLLDPLCCLLSAHSVFHIEQRNNQHISRGGVWVCTMWSVSGVVRYQGCKRYLYTCYFDLVTLCNVTKNAYVALCLPAPRNVVWCKL